MLAKSMTMLAKSLKMLAKSMKMLAKNMKMLETLKPRDELLQIFYRTPGKIF